MQYSFQSQVLIGTVLGGSSLLKPPNGNNYYLSMRGQNQLWLKYKMEEMSDYFSRQTIQKYGSTYRCNSCCSQKITEFHSILYNGTRRQITMELLDTLTDTGLAIWYLDNGSKTGRSKKNAYINTTKFGEKGTKIIIEYFNSLDMFCNLNRDGNRLKVLFSVDGTEALLRTIAHRFPTFMFHRV